MTAGPIPRNRPSPKEGEFSNAGPRENEPNTLIPIGVAAGNLLRKLEQMRNERARKG